MINRSSNFPALKLFHQPLLTCILVWVNITLVYPQADTSVNISNTISILSTDTRERIIQKAAHVVPTRNQFEALQNEFIAFIHFGPNTFTRMEWGNGMEDPKIFNLQDLDTDQWCKAMKEAEMKMVIITVKHHDGFVLWQSRYTNHSIMSSPFQNGQGDILRSLSTSCQKHGLKLGVYLSPADLYQIENKEGLYGNLSPYTERIIPRPVDGRPFKNKTTFTFTVDDYNEYFLNQLFELLTEYGPIHEVWFDGAHPKRKGGQKYNYLAWKELINTLAPKAVIFGKQDIRWCGNESGETRDTEWNIVPYQDDPNQMNRFADLTAIDLGSREKLNHAKFLHYQQAETNTSIREGWFYRDDEKQRVRSADDVFDIYERSVGGNSTFLLNIPPNRQGKFSRADVKVLEEVGQRIRETYSRDLLAGAQGPAEVIDGDKATFTLLADGTGALTVKTAEPITINRFVIQEAIRTHSERIEKHALDAWINNTWKEIAQASNVGYKRILRFPEVTSAKFRVRILQSRMSPAISNISAHHYKTRPPQLSIQRDREGVVTITSKKHAFTWKPHGEDPAANLNAGYQIRYTTDGTKPNHSSIEYKDGFLMNMGEVRAVAQIDQTMGSEVSSIYGPIKANWVIMGYSSEEEEHSALYAFDADEQTYWQSDENSIGNPFLSIDLGADYKLSGFTYTPQQEHAGSMIEQGAISVSADGKDWQLFERFTFGNLINDPTTRMHTFQAPRNTRYVRIESKAIAGQGTTAAVAELDFFVE